ncbi:MAG: histidine phosphatase family protein [Gammaproteobacteria bacterium]|nr:histidine phosphatase family protein [Gammaproteobacteria bacterium]MBQ0840923.1 histidine phosphatase family protein [Gammaproteobacteria bacterium]
MSEIYFVRHGQASLGAKDYDQLSELGQQQARWLGEHYRQRGLSFDRVITGDMRRHKQTLAGIEEGLGQSFESTIDAGFNEFHFRPIMSMYARRKNPDADVPRTAREFFGILRGTMRAWIDGELDAEIAQHDASKGGKTETWLDFNQRVGHAIDAARQGERGERVLVVSSGGPKALSMKKIMGLSDDAAIELMMQIRNTSTTRFNYNAERISLAAFNLLPHLEQGDRHDSITIV